VLPSVMKGKNIPCLIPLAIDQDPHFRVARDVYPKLGYYKPAIIHGMFLPPLTGTGGKMSSSIESSAIFTTDTPKEVEKKINKYAFSGGQPTIEEHRKRGGNPDIDVSYQYLLMMFEEDDRKLKKIHDDYKSGKLLTGELKKILIEKVNAFLKKHQVEREKAKKKINLFLVK
jgi:tryptophanyl-tRNA synthetase